MGVSWDCTIFASIISIGIVSLVYQVCSSSGNIISYKNVSQKASYLTLSLFWKLQNGFSSYNSNCKDQIVWYYYVIYIIIRYHTYAAMHFNNQIPKGKFPRLYHFGIISSVSISYHRISFMCLIVMIFARYYIWKYHKKSASKSSSLSSKLPNCHFCYYSFFKYYQRAMVLLCNVEYHRVS
jgi:hypothetical protein